jgi:uncharacterized membrane protein YheB (UPF0754 family)
MIQTIIILTAIPLVSALIGWITNLLAVKMIFRPRKEISVLGLRIIGVIPKRRNELAQKIAETVERELISHRDIHAILQTPEFHSRMGQVIREKLDSFIAEKIAGNSLLTLLVNPDLVSNVSDVLMEELQKMFPEMVDSLFEAVEDKVDFKRIIRNRIEEYDLIKLEKIIYSIASRELKSIEVMGGVIGFIIGMVQSAMLLAGRAL